MAAAREGLTFASWSVLRGLTRRLRTTTPSHVFRSALAGGNVLGRQYESLLTAQTQCYRTNIQKLSSSQQLEEDLSDRHSSTHVTSEEGLILSDSCVKQLLRVTEDEPGAMLRVIVEGGGCSGFQYKFNLDNQLTTDDKVFERDGARVVIDDLSLSLLNGSTIDYHQELIRSSFRIIDNPNSELGCSCGASFALK